MTGAPDLVPVGPGHLEVVTTLHGMCFDEPWGRDAIVGMIAGIGGFGLLALNPETGAPGGFVLARVKRDEAEILSLAVAAAYRRRGWARHLLAAALDESATRGADSLMLEVAQDNAIAIALYRHAGFRVVGHRANYYTRDGTAIDADIMRIEAIAQRAVR